LYFKVTFIRILNLNKIVFPISFILQYRPMKKGNFKLSIYTSNLKTHPIMKELNVK
jgi:hypothetical protein